VRYLGAAEIPIASPILSESGQFVERIDDREPGEFFVATAFERADGIVFGDAPPLKPPLFRDLGRLFAKLHTRAQTFESSNTRFARHQWSEYESSTSIGSRRATRRSCASAWLEALPRTPEHYGLIHADLHPHNFCFADGKIAAFDFDNCEHAWFVKDIACSCFTSRAPRSACERDWLARGARHAGAAVVDELRAVSTVSRSSAAR
jgi:amicoumacin kinase